MAWHIIREAKWHLIKADNAGGRHIILHPYSSILDKGHWPQANVYKVTSDHFQFGQKMKTYQMCQWCHPLAGGRCQCNGKLWLQVLASSSLGIWGGSCPKCPWPTYLYLKKVKVQHLLLTKKTITPDLHPPSDHKRFATLLPFHKLWKAFSVFFFFNFFPSIQGHRPSEVPTMLLHSMSR